VQGSRQTEETSTDQRRRCCFGFSLGVSVGQTRRHFLAIQEARARVSQGFPTLL